MNKKIIMFLLFIHVSASYAVSEDFSIKEYISEHDFVDEEQVGMSSEPENFVEAIDEDDDVCGCSDI